MPVVFLGLSLRWLIRILLALFWGISAPLQLTGIAPMLEWLWNDHVFYWTVLVISSTLAFEPRRRKKEVVLQT